jgi:hypothetical protein
MGTDGVLDTIRHTRSEDATNKPSLSTMKTDDSCSEEPSQNQMHAQRPNASKHEYLTKFSLLLTTATLLLLAVLSLAYSEPLPLSRKENRWLEVADDGEDGDSDNYSEYSCHHLYEMTPYAGDSQCKFSHTCNGGAGVWAPFVFCNKTFSPFFLAAIISPIMLLWMVILFRMLGSTAEDFFSPSLEMFSVKLGLPPRFAGVTLLAMGNGAADVSAAVAAITTDPNRGYELSLGALTGAAMFISAVVSAVVVLAADGVPCRGALVRDVAMVRSFAPRTFVLINNDDGAFAEKPAYSSHL